MKSLIKILSKHLSFLEKYEDQKDILDTLSDILEDKYPKVKDVNVESIRKYLSDKSDDYAQYVLHTIDVLDVDPITKKVAIRVSKNTKTWGTINDLIEILDSKIVQNLFNKY